MSAANCEDPIGPNRRNVLGGIASAAYALAACSLFLPTPVSAQSTIRVNCGGPAYTDPNGRYWSADYGHSGSEGVYDAGSQSINNTNTPTLYQTKRYSSWSSEMSYSFGVTNGTYTVTLKFAELAWDSGRRFDAVINGRQAMTNHSVYAAAPDAFLTAVDRTYTVEVTNGIIQIRFIPRVSSATINAIEILPSSVFSDVLDSTPYYNEVHFLREARITTGCTDSTFCPTETITRGQMAVFVIRGLFWSLKGTPENFAYNSSPYFSDVPSTHPWFKYIQKLKELGITIGCTSTTFCPNDPITWGQMAVFAVRAWQYRTFGQITDVYCPGATQAGCIPNTNPRLDVLGRPTPAGYFPSDAQPSHPWYNAIQKAVNLSLVDFVPLGKYYGSCLQQPKSSINPDGAGFFCLYEPIPRGESALLISRGVMGVYHPYSPLSKGISPSKAEVNLGPLPVDKYLDATSGISAGLTMCRDASLTVRGCVQKFFSPDMASPTYRADGFPQQGVKGVRFFFPLGSGGYSTPFHTNGTVDVEHWIPRLKAFFSDLKAYGVERVIPTPVFTGTWSGMGETPPPLCDGCFSYKSQSVSTCGGIDTRYFYPWIPFGFRRCAALDFRMDGSVSGFDCAGGGFPDAYNCAAAQPSGLFPGWSGWSNFFNLFREILKAARETGMSIGEFDLENELKVGWDFTVQARLLYDNTTLTDVVGSLRSIAVSEGFSSEIVTISTPLDVGDHLKT